MWKQASLWPRRCQQPIVCLWKGTPESFRGSPCHFREKIQELMGGEVDYSYRTDLLFLVLTHCRPSITWITSLSDFIHWASAKLLFFLLLRHTLPIAITMPLLMLDPAPGIPFLVPSACVYLTCMCRPCSHAPSSMERSLMSCYSSYSHNYLFYIIL